MSNHINIIVSVEEQDMRLDHLLVLHYPEISRSKFQEYIKEGHIVLNEKKVKPHTFVQAQDVIEGSIPEKTIFVEKEILPLNIVVQTDEYLIINKPAGLVVHAPHEQFPFATLVDALKKEFPDIVSVGEDPLRPGIVHRLDKEVSGLMVIAKTQAFFDLIKKQFQERTVEKKYIALVYDVLSQVQGVIDFPIEKKGTKMVVRPKGKEGKEARTEYVVKQFFQHYTLLEVSIQTGRTHQIRAHLSFLGHPIVGETVYIPSKFKRQRIFDRLFLHACELSFFDAQGEYVTYTSDVPEELQDFLTTLA